MFYKSKRIRIFMDVFPAVIRPLVSIINAPSILTLCSLGCH